MKLPNFTRSKMHHNRLQTDTEWTGFLWRIDAQQCPNLFWLYIIRIHLTQCAIVLIRTQSKLYDIVLCGDIFSPFSFLLFHITIYYSEVASNIKNLYVKKNLSMFPFKIKIVTMGRCRGIFLVPDFH